MRDTRTITLPSGKTAKLHTYLTGREKTELDGTANRHMKMGLEIVPGSNPKPFVESYDMAGQLKETMELLLRYGLAEYDGSSENAFEQLMNAHSDDLSMVLKELEPLDKSPKETKNSDGGMSSSEGDMATSTNE